MKKNFRISPYFMAVLSILLIAGYGCKDSFYDQQAGDRITPDQHYYSMNDADVSLQGAVVLLQDIMPTMIMLDGVRSDALELTQNADGYLQAINYQRITSDNPMVDPSTFYKVIINVNEVLANIDIIQERDRHYDSLTAHAYQGALVGLRCWTYFTLSKLYNKVAYIDGNYTSLPTTAQKIISKGELIPMLIEQILPYIQDNTVGVQYEELRIKHYVNNKAVLGEMYLEIGDYANAAKYLKMACESYNNTTAILKVDKTYQNAGWSNIFLNAESQDIENIAVIPYSRAEDQYNQVPKWFGRDYEYVVRPSTILVDSFMSQVAADGTIGDLFRGKGVTFNADTTAWITDSTFVTMPYITKYEVDNNDPFSTDIIISRAADLHLLLAEAYNRMGDPASQKNALMLLNQGVNKESPKPAGFSKWTNNLGVRGRAYLKSREVPKNMISTDSITNLIEDFIMDERAMELAFEGKRWFDLVRVAERRNDPEYLANKVAAKFEGTSYYDEVHTKLMNPANWYLPFK